MREGEDEHEVGFAGVEESSDTVLEEVRDLGIARLGLVAGGGEPEADFVGAAGELLDATVSLLVNSKLVANVVAVEVVLDLLLFDVIAWGAALARSSARPGRRCSPNFSML